MKTRLLRRRRSLGGKNYIKEKKASVDTTYGNIHTYVWPRFTPHTGHLGRPGFSAGALKPLLAAMGDDSLACFELRNFGVVLKMFWQEERKESFTKRLK